MASENNFKEMANNGILVPNQNKIFICKSLTDSDNPYIKLNNEALEESFYNFSNRGVGFKLYLYLAMNKDEREFNLSSAHFMAFANCSRKAYTNAFKELVELGYLVLEETNENNNGFYTFYDKSTLITPYHEQLTKIKYSDSQD